MLLINKMNNYFCCCDDCGSVEWVDNEIEEEGINSLTSDGSLLSKDKNYDMAIFEDGFPLCIGCEKTLKLIPFREVDIRQRKKIFEMDEEDRVKWARSYWMCKELEKE